MSTMKLNRTIKGYSQSVPKEQAKMSEAAVMYALDDARHDILVLASLLARIAYPRRGTADEHRPVQIWANEIQQVITHEEAVEHIP